MVKKQEYWNFLKEAQPWIANNKQFAGIAEEKLKYFVHDDENFIVTNFDFIYQRIKGLVENFSLNARKLEEVFSKPVHKRKGNDRIKRKHPGTLKLRQKFKRFKSRQNI